MVLRSSLLTAALLLFVSASQAQDTFSIVAVDPATGEVGSAGASCVDLFAKGRADVDFIGDLVPGIGVVITQAKYDSTNQVNARARMLAGDSPTEIIAWLRANDAEGNDSIRQYGVVRLMHGGAQAAAHTGAACPNYAGSRVGPNYSIQGNILLGPAVLDSMEARFLRTPGPLAERLMSAMQGANVVGADSRCAANQSSALFAFLKVAAPTDSIPSILLGLRTHGGAMIEPIDSLQTLFNNRLQPSPVPLR